MKKMGYGKSSGGKGANYSTRKQSGKAPTPKGKAQKVKIPK